MQSQERFCTRSAPLMETKAWAATTQHRTVTLYLNSTNSDRILRTYMTPHEAIELAKQLLYLADIAAGKEIKTNG